MSQVPFDSSGVFVGGRWQLDPSTAFVSSSTALYDPTTNTWSTDAMCPYGFVAVGG